jgi:alanyl-tRNA synthetase
VTERCCDESRAELDWARRWDHMQCHTGQHVLSACAQRDLGAATASWELLSETVTVTLEVGTLSAESVETLEKAVNAEIRANRAVRVRDLSHEEAVAASMESIFRYARREPLRRFVRL